MEKLSLSHSPLPQSGDEWIDKITLDVLDCLLDFLDIGSIVKLGMVSFHMTPTLSVAKCLTFLSQLRTQTCKALQENASGSKLLWLRIVRGLTRRHNLAPNSIPMTDESLSELKRVATRLERFRYSIASSDSDLCFQNTTLTRLAFTPYIDQQALGLPPVLLPGGRWLISFVITMEVSDPRTHLLCWDLSQAISNGQTWSSYDDVVDSLEPVAQTSFLGVPIVSGLQGAVAQLDAGGEAVNIATQFTLDNVHLYVSLFRTVYDKLYHSGVASFLQLTVSSAIALAASGRKPYTRHYELHFRPSIQCRQQMFNRPRG